MDDKKIFLSHGWKIWSTNPVPSFKKNNYNVTDLQEKFLIYFFLLTKVFTLGLHFDWSQLYLILVLVLSIFFKHNTFLTKYHNSLRFICIIKWEKNITVDFVQSNLSLNPVAYSLYMCKKYCNSRKLWF